MFVKHILFVVNFLALKFLEVSSDNVQVTTNEGTILGKTSLSEKNHKMYMFHGIPYAEPPKRFELSVAKSNWTGVLDCTRERAQCVQGRGIIVQGSEDCLFLNVASPNAFNNYPLTGIALGPVLEVPHPTAFLTVKSDNSILSGQFTRVPVLVGYNTNEVGIMAPLAFSGSVPTLQSEPKKFVPVDIISDKNLTEAGLKIRKEFFGNAPYITMDSNLIN
uniref:Venom carboxylesterase-6-like n=1 Tax=Diabrotica virgifera virgifera TaxID=50390 RepID=A0A6P7GWW1_DIAVI